MSESQGPPRPEPSPTDPPGEPDGAALDARALARLRDRLHAQLRQPGRELAPLLDRAWQRLAAEPAGAHAEARIECLLAIVQLRLMSQDGAGAVDAAELAVTAARAAGTPALLRRALNAWSIALYEAGDTPQALEAAVEGLDSALLGGEPLPLWAHWNTAGVALVYMALYDEALRCFERALAAATQLPDRPGARLTCLQNIALCCLHLEDHRRGLDSAEQAVGVMAGPGNLQDSVNLVLAEYRYVRFLLHFEQFDRARERCRRARELAARCGAPRAAVMAGLAEGLTDVYDGRVDLGLSRIEQALARARTQNSVTLRDALNALALAYERANEPDKAMIVLRELVVHTRTAQQDALRVRQSRHLQRLALGHPPRLAPETLLERRASVLRARAAEIEMKRARMELIERLAVVAELREDPSGEHCYRVGRLSALLAEAAGYDDGFCVSLELAARLHDLGKLAVPDGVLLRPGRLREREWDLVRRHTHVGAEMLRDLEGDEARMAQEIMLYHHAWWNGTGYPADVSHEAIPVAARIVALADSFDAMTHPRAYRPAYPVEIALSEIAYLGGKQFDPRLTEHFIRLIGLLKAGGGDLDTLLARAAGASTFVRVRQRLGQLLAAAPASPTGAGATGAAAGDSAAGIG